MEFEFGFGFWDLGFWIWNLPVGRQVLDLESAGRQTGLESAGRQTGLEFGIWNLEFGNGKFTFAS